MNGNGNPARHRAAAPERQGYLRDLNRIVEFVDDNLGNGGRFQRPDDTEWKIQRRKTIRTLNELRRKLDKICVYCNYGKGVGLTAEIAGAAASIAGALMALYGRPSARNVMNVGRLVQHSGALVEGASNGAEALLLYKLLNELQTNLGRDQELSEPFMNLLLTSANLDATIRELFGCDLESAKLSNVLKTFYELSRLHNQGVNFQNAVDLMKCGRYSVHIGTEIKLEYLQRFFAQIEEDPELADSVRTALSVLSVSVGSLQVARDAVAVYRYLWGEGASAEPASLRGGINAEIPTVGTVSTFCVFQTISIASSVVTLRNVVKVIREGKSGYSDALKQLSDWLELELRSMEVV